MSLCHEEISGQENGLLLAADIGGTKSDIAIFRPNLSCTVPVYKKRYLNRNFSGVLELVDSFLASSNYVPTVGCLAVAGIVRGNCVQMTNLPWKVDGVDIEKRFGFKRITIINDMTGLCSSLPQLATDDLFEIQRGTRQKGGVRAVVAVGTGLGEGLFAEIDGRGFPWGTEGGHVDFAPVDDVQLSLLKWMQGRGEHVNYEMVIGGVGLSDLYDFCREYYKLSGSSHISEAMGKQQDRTPLIIDGVLNDPPCSLCIKVIELFLTILGGEAGNLALKVYADGGLYIGGGIVPRLLGKISFTGFLESFRNKGIMADMLSNIPVYVIKKEDAGLVGAACFAANSFFVSTTLSDP